MAIQFRIYKNNGYIIAARYDTATSQYTDQTPVNIPAQYLAINIIKADPADLIAFSCVAYEKPYRELARLPYSEIYDENGVLYSGADVAAVRDSLIAALSAGTGGGGGGGDATAANQVLQITELQNINANTLPVAVLFNRVQIVGLSGFSIPRPFRWAKIERPSIGGSIDNDSVTIQDANGGFSELYAGDTIELPLLSLQNIYNFNLDVQISNPDIELFISYNE